ncbi:MAG: hypothetical protein ACPG80_02900 [Rickettsiales bacterium]
MLIDIEVKDVQHLNLIITNLRQQSIVQAIQRYA